MASLVKLARIINPLTSKNTGCFYNVIRPKVYTNADWMPGPYPKTEEERKKAAKKYGLSPEEYEPYPDDGHGLGDYPKLPLIGRAARDPYYPWDDTAHKRNLGEPMHKDDNIIGEDRWDAGVKPPVSGKFAYKMFFGVVGTLTLTILWFDRYPLYPEVVGILIRTMENFLCTQMEKQIPKPGVVHYTFEPAH